jgi:hypothetical protein
MWLQVNCGLFAMQRSCLLFGLGQAPTGWAAVGQIAIGIEFGLGQVATGFAAIGQMGFGKYVLAQIGFGE